MDRQYWASWRGELDDREFPPALAALGVLAAAGASFSPTDGSASGDAATFLMALDRAKDGVFDWRIPVRRAGPLGGWPTWPNASALRAAWCDYLRQSAALRPGGLAPGPRLSLRSDLGHPARAIPYARLLATPEVGARSVNVASRWTTPRRTSWHWPFTMATLIGDPLADRLLTAQASRPAGSPFRVTEAERGDPQVEVLVIGAGVADALAKVLSAHVRLRCALLVVCGFAEDSPEAAEPLLRALMLRLSASGVAVAEGIRDGDDMVSRLMNFADRLVDNEPIDQALLGGFKGRVVCLLGDDLLRSSRLEDGLAHLSRRLRRLPPDTRLSFTASADTPLARRRGVDGHGAEARAGDRGADLATALEVSAKLSDTTGVGAAWLPKLTRELQAAESLTHTPRYVHHRSFRQSSRRFVEERRGYVIGEAVKVRFRIGPKKVDSLAAPTAFPEEALPHDGERHRLQLIFHEPRQWKQPLQTEIWLPERGDSTSASFRFVARVAGDFVARLTVLHRGRVLQTLLLRAAVVERREDLRDECTGIRLEDEARVRHDWSNLGARRHFDLAFVFNHSVDGRPRLTGIAEQRAWATDLSAIEQPVREINDLISSVANTVADHQDGLDQGDNPALLVQLARIGADVYSKLYIDQLQQLNTAGFDVGDDSISHIQVLTTRSDALVPIEFLYDWPPPDADAQVCPQHLQALQEGRCPGGCARMAAPNRYVCPMGFWGLRKVIERHFYSAAVGKPDGAELVVQSEPSAQRDQLDLRAGALVAHSREVTEDEMHELIALMESALPGEVGLVGDWDDWKQGVTKRPGLLVAFPHNEGRKQDVRLEIGGSYLSTLRLPAEYVRAPGAPPPLVFLLGCDTASTAEDYASHVRYFRQAGAAVVVSTIATVFGQHAVIVGEKILGRLLAGDGRKSSCLGEIIRDAKREALRASVPMALCVVAFGDADWQI